MPDTNKIFHFELDPRLKSHSAILELIKKTNFLVKVFFWKTQTARNLAPILCVMGGTGTGKSTIFNSLAMTDVSMVGVKRPCTMNAVILAHGKYGETITKAPLVFEGKNREAELLLEQKSELENIVLIDTPDFDSVSSANKTSAERFLIIGDVIMFVTSQEKYGDLACRRMLEEAISWGKKIELVLNKVSSNVSLDDYLSFTKSTETLGDPVVVPRLNGTPTHIDSLREYPQVRAILGSTSNSSGASAIKNSEIERLRERTGLAIEEIRVGLAAEIDRICQVNSNIEKIASKIAEDLTIKLNAIVSEDIEKRMRSRLQGLLRKYDILFVPRLMLRNAFNTALGYFTEILFSTNKPFQIQPDEKKIRFEDFGKVEEMTPLGPLDLAVTDLNLRIAEFLTSNSDLDDLRLIALLDVQRFDFMTIKSMYDEAFPGLENLLEVEFEKVRGGLSRFDEVKLYGSYTLWALLLITFEIVIGGGLTLLDLLLNSVIVPFIPKWLLDLKILDLLKSIAQRVDTEHKACLKNILYKQMQLYTKRFASLISEFPEPAEIEALKLRIFQAGK